MCGERGGGGKREKHCRRSKAFGITWSRSLDLLLQALVNLREHVLGKLHHFSPSISGAASHGPLGTFIWYSVYYSTSSTSTKAHILTRLRRRTRQSVRGLLTLLATSTGSMRRCNGGHDTILRICSSSEEEAVTLSSFKSSLNDSLNDTLPLEERGRGIEQ